MKSNQITSLNHTETPIFLKHDKASMFEFKNKDLIKKS